MKISKRFLTQLITLMLCVSVFAVPAMAKNKVVEVPYGENTKITVSRSCIGPKETAKVKAAVLTDKSECKVSIRNIAYKNLTPSVISVSGKGIIKGRKSGLGKVKVTVVYKIREKVYRKCSGVTQSFWSTRYCKESRTLKVRVSKLLSGDHFQILGGSVQLSFSVDGKPYAAPMSIGVGINPAWDYAKFFPADPVRKGYEFLGWYTKRGTRIGTTAAEIYPAFNKIVSGSKATVYAKWKKLL